MGEDEVNGIVEQWIGCTAMCPYCQKKCTLSQHDSTKKHECKCHQPIGFGGIVIEATRKPRFIYCDEFDNQNQLYKNRKNGQYELFSQHVESVNPSWRINLAPDDTRFEKMKAGFERIWNHDRIRAQLCEIYKMEESTWAEGTRAAKAPLSRNSK